MGRRGRGRGRGRGGCVAGYRDAKQSTNNIKQPSNNQSGTTVLKKPKIEPTTTPAKSAMNMPKKPPNPVLNPHSNPNLRNIPKHIASKTLIITPAKSANPIISPTSNTPGSRTVEFKSGVGMSVKTTVDAQQQEGAIDKVVNASPKCSALQGCSEYALLITEDIRRSIVIGYPEKSAKQRMHLHNFWHKFVITNGCKYYKDYILKLILDTLSFSSDLIPVMYQKQEPNTFFYAKNCNNAIEKLCRLNFIIPMNNNGATPPLQKQIVMQLVLAALPLSEIPYSIQDKAVQNALDKRYKISTKSLNLKDFHNDTALSEVVFLPLARPSILQYVINCAKSSKYLGADSISLADNELTDLKSLDGLWNFKSLRSLNLGYNKIPTVEDLLVLKNLPLTDLILDNNPLCQEFTYEAAYVKIVTEMFPKLKTLDGILLSNSSGMPQACRNFLVSPEGGPLADQFLQHYFTLFDEPDRRKLFGIYHPTAIFSLTSVYLPGQSTSANARLTEYMVHSRNLQKLSDYSKAQHLMVSGADAVIRLLCGLPKTWHDPHSFTVDLANYSIAKKFASLMVCGVFREPNGLVRAFTRTFLLKAVAPNEWQITNEMWHVSNARTDDAKQAFSILREPTALPNVTILNKTDREQMTEILSQLTDMNKVWAIKCLLDTDWDFREALATFTDLYKSGKVPLEAFEKCGTREKLLPVRVLSKIISKGSSLATCTVGR